MYFNLYSVQVFLTGLIMLKMVVMTFRYNGWKVSREKALNFI